MEGFASDKLIKPFCLQNILGLIVTGGNTNDDRNELLFANGNHWCMLPKFQEKRFLHTQNGLTACGGPVEGASAKSCVTLTKGEWTNKIVLNKNRHKHTSWTRPDGKIILLSGWFDRFTPASVSSYSCMKHKE